MEDKFNTGEARYLDKDGKELTEQEYLKLLKKQGSRVRGFEGSSENQEPETRVQKP